MGFDIMSDRYIELHCGKFSEVEAVEDDGVLCLLLKTERVSRMWRAFCILMIFGLLLNLFGLYAYYTLGEKYKPTNADDLLVVNYLATAGCLFCILLLFKLWRTTRRSHWETKISKETGRLESVSAHEWVGFDRKDWAVRRLVVPGNPLGAVTKDTHVLLVQTLDQKTVVPVFASVSSEFDRVFDIVLETSGQSELKTLSLKNKISATGNVRFQVGPDGILNTVSMN